MGSTSKKCNLFGHSVAKRSRTATSWQGIWPTRTRLGHLKGSQRVVQRVVARVSFTSAPRKTCSFAYDTREVCEADPIECPRPLLDFSVHAPSTNANEPHQAQDLGKRVQEKLVNCNVKSDPKIFTNPNIVSHHLIYTGQGKECRTHSESYASRKTFEHPCTLQCKRPCVASRQQLRKSLAELLPA